MVILKKRANSMLTEVHPIQTRLEVAIKGVYSKSSTRYTFYRVDFIVLGKKLQSPSGLSDVD